MTDWQAFNAGHVLSHLRPDLDHPLRDWLAWLLNLAPQQRPHSVAQALDVLMHSMHTGFTYMPQQAPAMAPGTQTTSLVSPSHPNAPKPKPVVSKAVAAAAAAAVAETATPAVAPQKKRSSRVMIAVGLNLATLAVIGIYLWPTILPSLPSLELTATATSKSATTTATPVAIPAAKAADTKATPPVPAVKVKAPAAQAATPAANATAANTQ